jgi:hypothetical protein
MAGLLLKELKARGLVRRVTYFTSGVTWSADYLLIADKDEKQLSFDGFVRVSNNSGEEYEDA